MSNKVERMKNSLILDTDSYKPSHWLQYPPKTEFVFSYIESRGGQFSEMMFAGLQPFAKEYLSRQVTQQDIEDADAFLTAHGLPFNRKGWERLIEKHNGYLPLKIKAAPEGKILPVLVPMVTVINTDPEFYWMTSYIETALLRAIWYMSTVGTISWSIKKLILSYLDRTGDPAGISFKLHDFGARGVSSKESGSLGDLAHLFNFMGTDTIVGIIAAMEYYNATVMPAFSIPAAEHSSITSWGRDKEVDAYRNMIKQFGKPGALVAVVSDSYDIMKACDLWGTELKQDVIDSGAIVVIRPDSGDPATVVLDVVRRLDKNFGSVKNAKGYKVLNNVRVIQGDGVNEVSIRGILMNLEFAGYSADNVAFGMGGALLQQMNRDTQKFAMKASAARIDGKWVDVYKDPVTDTGKRSKRGRITLVERAGEFQTVLEDEVEGLASKGWTEVLQTVWENGKLLKDWTLDEVRAEANKPFVKETA